MEEAKIMNTYKDQLTPWYPLYNGLDWGDTEKNPYGFSKNESKAGSLTIARVITRKVIESLI